MPMPTKPTRCKTLELADQRFYEASRALAKMLIYNPYSPQCFRYIKNVELTYQELERHEKIERGDAATSSDKKVHKKP